MAIQTREMLAFEEFDSASGFHEVTESSWYKVIIASGTFTVKACCGDTAILKCDSYAEDLRNSRRVLIEIGNGLPFVSVVTADEKIHIEKSWYEGKPEVSLTEYRQECAIDATSTNENDSRIKSDPLQGTLFANKHVA